MWCCALFSVVLLGSLRVCLFFQEGIEKNSIFLVNVLKFFPSF